MFYNAGYFVGYTLAAAVTGFVIGVFAGAGLRLCGNDGTFRGKTGKDVFNITATADRMAAKLQADAIITLLGEYLPDNEMVTIEQHAKLAFRDHKIVVIAAKNNEGRYVICLKRQMYDGDSKLGNVKENCPSFAMDNDYEECYDEVSKNCYNCLYRRWSAKGFLCVKVL